jgi:single-stranded-DNA-specific exonuclease
VKARWKIPSYPAALSAELSRQLDIPPLIAQLLIKRGITDSQSGERFLFPSLQHLHDPFLMKDMSTGAERVVTALERGEKITIYGDYDVDGVSACALLVNFLRSSGNQATYYIPHRLQEGYGLNAEAVKQVAAEGTKLLICVDCGISDREEIQLAQSLGMDTIVVDHHEPPPLPSPAYAVLDPLQADCPFPFKGLAGVGVAFYLVIALRSKLREKGFWRDGAEPNLNRYLDLVALGTIADIVPLMDINRVLVTYGLRELRETLRPGLRALKEVSGIGGEEISTGHVAFRLAPRLNAGGRMADAQMGVELLLTDDYEQAQRIAGALDQANRERQKIEERIYQEAKEIIKRDGLFNRRSMVLSSDRWHPGVIGIVASRIVEEFWRPAILIALEGDRGKGSARSIAGFHLYQGLQECGGHLVGFGGHKYAAGLTIDRDKIQAFREGFEEVAKKNLGEEDLIPTLSVDAELDPEEITPDLLRHILGFAPYGPTNPKPLFATRNRFKADDVRVLGKNTLKFKLRGGKRTFEVIGFGMGELITELSSELKIAFYPRMDDWQGVRRLQLELRAVDADTSD